MQKFGKMALAGVSLWAFAAPAYAQDAVAKDGDEAGYESAEIVVQARRRDESAQEVPLVVNTVTSEKITQLNLRDFREIQSVVPGLTMNANANGIGTTSSVRGVNFDVNASGNNGTIEYYLNDAPLSSGALFNAMYDIGQIEVLRGPQGTLRGRAAPSGSITIGHRRPDLDEAGGYVMGTLNDIGGTNVNAAINVPIIEDVLAIRVAGLYDRNQANRVRSLNSTLKPYGETMSGRVFVRFEPADFFNAEAVYQRVELESRQFDQVASFNLFDATAPAAATPIAPEDRLAVKPLPQSANSKFDIFTWKASAGFAGQRLYYVGSHLRQKVSSYGPQDEANAYPALAMGQFTTNDSRITSHEVRLQNEERIAGMFDYVAGYFTTKLSAPTSLLTQRFVGTTANPSVFTSAALRGTNTKEESFFGNLTVHLGDAFELSGGARHIKINQKSSLGSVTIPGGIVVPSPYATDISGLVGAGTVTDLAFGAVNRTFEKTIYTASAKYKFSDAVMVYANFGTSFRPGNNVVRSTVNFRASPLETSFLVLPSETSKSYEVGLKTSFLDDTLRLNVAAFQQDYENYAFRSASGVFYLQYDSAATAVPGRVATFNFVAPVPVRVRGFEVEATWRPSDRFSLSANLAYALGKIRNGQVPCLDLNGDGIPDTVASAPQAQALYDVVGADNLSTCGVNFRSMSASPWNGNVQAEYNMPVNDSTQAFVRGLATISGASLNDPSNSYDNYGKYARVNLFLGLRDVDGAWEIAAYAKNLTDNNTVLATTNGPAFTTVGSSTVSSRYIGLGSPSIPGLTAPREFGVTMRYAFGSR